jgi:excisionase family DNA binding protein
MDAAAHQADLQGLSLITVRDLSEILCLSEQKLYGLAKRNEIPHYRITPKSIRFRRSEVLDWLEQRMLRHSTISRRNIGDPLDCSRCGNTFRRLRRPSKAGPPLCRKCVQKLCYERWKQRKTNERI